MTTSEKNKRALRRMARGADNLLPIVVYRKGEVESLDAPEPGDVPVRPEGMKNLEITLTNTECGCSSKPTDVRIEGGQIRVELSGELTNKLGKGVYRLDLTYDEPNSHYADGMRHIALAKECCKVVDPKDATEPMAAELRLEVQAMLKGDKGDTGLSAYDWAVEQGLCSTPEQFVEVFRGATGLSAYELYLASTRDSPKKTLEEWLASNKGETGDSAYQSYVKTHTGGEVLSERDWSNLHNYSLGVLHRLLRGKNVPMEEKKLTGEELIELHTTIQKLATALQSQGIQANEEEGLESFVPKVEAYEPMHIVLFKQHQLYGWRQADLGREVEISPSWDNPSLNNMMSDNPFLKRVPTIKGIERAADISAMLDKCSGISGGISLPALPKVEKMNALIRNCGSVTSLSIGDAPLCKSISQIAFSCAGILWAEVGDLPMLEDSTHAFASCPKLERVVFSGGVSPKYPNSMFQSSVSLREVSGVIDVSNSDSHTSIINDCPSLEEVRIKGIKYDTLATQSAKLSIESIRYMVDNAQAVTGKTIYLNSALLEEHEDELTAIGETATQKGWTINYR